MNRDACGTYVCTYHLIAKSSVVTREVLKQWRSNWKNKKKEIENERKNKSLPDRSKRRNTWYTWINNSSCHMFIDISLSHSAVPASRWDRGTPYIRHSEIYYGREIYTRIINITKLPWVGFVLDNTGATTSCRRSERRTDHHNVLTLVTRVFLSLRLILLGDAHCSTCSIRRSRRYPRTRQTRWRTKPSSRIKCSFMDESIGGISSRVTVLPREWSCDHDCLVSRLICVRVSKLCTVDDTFFALKVPCFAAHCVLRIYVISLIIWYKKWFYSLDGSYIYIYI